MCQPELDQYYLKTSTTSKFTFSKSLHGEFSSPEFHRSLQDPEPLLCALALPLPSRPIPLELRPQQLLMEGDLVSSVHPTGRSSDN